VLIKTLRSGAVLVSRKIMQDRYAGDIGDFVKLGLLRALSPGRQLGIAWYRFPDESHNGDGRHVGYLDRGSDDAALDPELHAHLRDVTLGARSISSLLPVLHGVASSDESLDVSEVSLRDRRDWRRRWFARVLEDLSGCDIVFADPDNGIIDDDDKRKGAQKFGKQIPLAEARLLAEGRCAVIYHHNTRRKGGHDAEVDYWISQFDTPTIAVRSRAYSCRTFFVLNPDVVIAERAKEFCRNWRGIGVSMHGPTR
jgi:hypothetical protein